MDWNVVWLAGVFTAGLAAASCGTPGSDACSITENCNLAGVPGRCVGGQCQLPDETCSSGWLVQESQECVPDDAGDETTEDGGDDGQQAVCGDGLVSGEEECDDGNEVETDACLSNCELARCGDGEVRAGFETCDDGNEIDSDACPSTCETASCGDGFVWQGMEACDDANASNEDGCLTTCEAAACGDGFVWQGMEACDDANATSLDGCTTQCQLGSLVVGDISDGAGHITSALDELGETYDLVDEDWPDGGSAGVIIVGLSGGFPPPSYESHLANGGHLFVVGGSATEVYTDAFEPFFTIDFEDWHGSTDCLNDWIRVGPEHPIVAALPETYEFPNQENTSHMLHFSEAGQPEGTVLLGRTCHDLPDNYSLVTRRLEGGGTITYFAHIAGSDRGSGEEIEAEFIRPLLEGYLEYVRSAPQP